MQERTNSSEGAGRRPSPSRSLASWYAQGLSDALGDRLLMFDNSGAASLELLRFRRQLADLPGFEAALREQVKRLGQFRHPAFARVRSVQRLEPDDDLALVSNCPNGKRLSDVLHRARGPAFASALVQQLAPALVLFQQHEPGAAHGILNPDRIVVSPEGRLTVIEQVVGPAIEAVEPRPAQLASMGIALPPSPDALSPLGVATDWYQLGLVAVSVLIGRPIADGELPKLDKLLDGLAYSARADGSGLSPFMRQWLDRALQISGTRIESGADARAALDELLRKESARDSRRIDTPRREEVASPSSAPPPQPAPATPPWTDPLSAAVEVGASSAAPAATSHLREVAKIAASAPQVVVVEPARASASIEAFAPEQEPIRTPDPKPAAPEMRVAPVEAPRAPSPVHTRALFEPVHTRALFEKEALAGKNRFLDLVNETALQDAAAATQAGKQSERRGLRSVVAALVLLALVEAGVIAYLARALWFTPRSPLTVETTPTGDTTVVSTGGTVAAPLALAVAPDLRWARVSSPSSDRVLGGKVTDTPPGTVQISSPIALKVYEGSRLLGSVPGADLRMAAGSRDIELVNAALGFRLKQTIVVEAGQTVSIHVAPPHGWVTIDASPWAEVSIDGQPVGRTPLGPLPLALGEHVITFRHPAGSKDQRKVMVKSEATTRVIGNLRF